ncbi:unnamed protein product [Ambrosiozyma monospora]|uniref:Unnamed protein product n=1 Tax=Ambrosiozyma monospora TaxID=43982 RepID=A0A9W6Z2B6_AMBMO|nr:unnamed protein product [Ambrosiozyma monospora]
MINKNRLHISIISSLVFLCLLILPTNGSFPPPLGGAPGLGQSLTLEKKPTNSNPQSDASIHNFNNTPFKNWEKFTQSSVEESCGVSFATINDLNSKIVRPTLKKLVNENFFKIFRLNLYKECPFWSGSEGFCMHRSCAVDTIDDWAELPEIWQPEALGKLEGASKESPIPLPNPAGRNVNGISVDSVDGSCIVGPSKKDKSKDYCELDENNQDVVYVNLVDNPERFTGYGGDQSFQIWKTDFWFALFYFYTFDQ